MVSIVPWFPESHFYQTPWWWVVGCWLQPVTSVIIKNTKKNTNPNYTKIQHWGGKNQQQKGNTTYIGGFAVLFFDGMSKERKKYKRTKCNLWRNGKIQKNAKNTSVFVVFLQNKYRKNRKKNKINTNAISQKYQIPKKTKQKFQNTKYKKKYEPKISKIQNTKKNTSSEMGQRANPMFILKS